MRIDVWSDVVCPWCYVGKRRLERALGELPFASGVALRHRAFQLDPGAPKGETRSRQEMLKAKYRLSDQQLRALDDRMIAVAGAESLPYRMVDGVTGNTEDAHRLLRLAREQERDGQLLDRLYRAYFAEGRSVFDAPSLTELAVEAGLERQEVERVLRSRDYAADVHDDQERARALGVTGVPFFVVDDRYGIAGAQPLEVFRDVLERAWHDRPQSPDAPAVLSR